ncbi:hypothetical protein A8C56_19100 [Niabella ginsenosidivorans]|uniref:Uncharacterized protein n=1 Tax=Niabella ginsenosidivorans TaxID=1176587 RepID=A0A1A9I552_9BACT|nr:hypothetical protein A8C56_19100 [Niabella ginsenosidivorans]
MLHNSQQLARLPLLLKIPDDWPFLKRSASYIAVFRQFPFWKAIFSFLVKRRQPSVSEVQQQHPAPRFTALPGIIVFENQFFKETVNAFLKKTPIPSFKKI